MEENNAVEKRSIDQFVDELIENWSESGKRILRPSEKHKLKQLIALAIPQLLSKNMPGIYIDAVRQRQKNLCIEAISALPEPFPGVLNKQRVLNACEFAESESVQQLHLKHAARQTAV